MTKNDIFKMIRNGEIKEAYKAATEIYIEGRISEETYDKILTAIWEAKES